MGIIKKVQAPVGVRPGLKGLAGAELRRSDDTNCVRRIAKHKELPQLVAISAMSWNGQLTGKFRRSDIRLRS